MAYTHFDSSYAPCRFLIVRDNGNPYDDTQTVLIQTDWELPDVARNMGWDMKHILDSNPQCDHESTDGTVRCRECGKTPSEFISQAYDFIREHEGENFEALDEYLERAA